MKVKLSSVALLALCVVIVSACAPPPPATLSGPVAVNLLLTYQPDVQFAPFYVGIEKGFFKNHLIELTVQHLAETDVTKQVGTNEAAFGVVSGEQVLMAREVGLPVSYTYSWFQQYPVAVVSKADKGIDSAEKLYGHSVGIPLRQGASYIGLRAALQQVGLDETDIDLQETGFTQVQTLMSDKVDAVVVYANNEPIQLEAQGVAINVISVSDYVTLISNGIISNEQTIRERPELVRALLAAFDESLRYTIDNPDEAFEISKKYVEGLNDPALAATQREVLARSIDLWRSDQLGLTEMSGWEDTQAVLLAMGLLAQPQNLEGAFTTAFLPPVNSEP